MIISHSRKFIFVHIHKTAGESVTEALLPFLGRGDVLLGTTFRGEITNAWYNRRHGVQKHTGARRLRKHLGEAVWNDYLKFSFVRDPYDRLRSLYFYFEKMLDRRQQPSWRNALLWLPGTDFRDPLKWPGMQAFRETASFSEFIRHPEFSPSIFGARPQAVLLTNTDGSPAMDVVGKFETLGQDFDAIAARLGLEGAALGHRNASRNRAAASTAETDPAELADRAHVARLYDADYALFGYPSPAEADAPAAAAAVR
jgi:Sulfotransferase family